ncbi:MAG TPA: ABC transporter permease [Verrucomicrobiae bacterium]|nr:ABC transporter permease [Verrucomicrobiae bacterium]
MRQFIARVRMWLRRERFERDLDEEMRLHLELRQRRNEAEGMDRAEARERAVRGFGNMTELREQSRETWGLAWMEQLGQDLRYGLRNMRRSPGFTAVAVIALALGIGANTAIFSVVNAVLLRPLPYRDPGELVTILHDGTNPVAVENYLDWRDQAKSFETMAAADYWTPNLTGADPPEHLWGLRLSQNLLPMLGVQPMLGRVFAPGEDQKGAEHEVVLSYKLWQRRFAGDPGVLGTAIHLDGEAYTVIGVMPPEFQFAPFWATRAELYAPNVLTDRAQNRSGNSLRVFARLKPKAPLERARTEMAAITGRLEREYPGTNRGVMVRPLMENVVGRVETPMLVLLAAVGFVLLIACANVAHLLLARAAARRREIAVRAALGAGRMRMVRQFLTESLLLAMLGGAAGLLLALAGTRALVALSPPDIPRITSVSIDVRVVVFLQGVTLLAGLLFGLAPALHASMSDLAGAVKEGGRGSSEGIGRNRVRSLLVTSEFALAMMLLAGAGLMIRSFNALEAIDPGWDPHHVLSMIVSVAGSSEAAEGRREVFYREMLDRVRRMPGVESAGGINHLPLAGDLWGWSFHIEGRPKAKPGESPVAIYRIATPGYLSAMKLPLVRGRDIQESDTADAPGVVLINERAAKQYWRSEDPIGQRVTFADDEKKQPIWLTVVGIVKDARQADWAEEPEPEAYLAAFQNRGFMGAPGAHMSYITLVARVQGDAAAMAPPLKRAVWSLDRNLPISEVLTMDEVVARETAEPRFEMMLLGIFAGVALALAAVGIYGVLSYAVSRRTHEIGIRVSLGAARRDVLRMVIGQGMTLVLAGTVIGVGGALALSKLMAKLVYGVKPTDPLTLAGGAAVLAVVALVAAGLPAWRAARIDPVTALRCE